MKQLHKEHFPSTISTLSSQNTIHQASRISKEKFPQTLKSNSSSKPEIAGVIRETRQ
jgi:hypothetical protein